MFCAKSTKEYENNEFSFCYTMLIYKEIYGNYISYIVHDAQCMIIYYIIKARM